MHSNTKAAAVIDPVDAEFAILGAGAIGSILGAHLARAGYSVVMLARGRRAAQIGLDGLKVTGLVDLAERVPILTEPSRLRSAGVLVVAMKTMGTADALAKLRQAKIGTALSLQNGVLKDSLLAEVFGKHCVLGAVADLSGEVRNDGVAVFTRNVNVLLGEVDGLLSARAQSIAAAIEKSGVRAAAVSDICSVEWSKFTAWVGLLVLSVTTRAETWRYLSNPDSARVLVRVVREMGQVALAHGFELTDRAALPVAGICHAAESEALDLVMSIGRHFARHAPEHRMSSLQDLHAERPLEIHETLGYVLQKAQERGLSLPLLATFYPLVSAIEQTYRLPTSAQSIAREDTRATPSRSDR